MSESNFYHTPVLLKQVIKYLNPGPNQNFIDCTLGGGGHALSILKRTGPQGKLLGIDLDKDAIRCAQKILARFNKRAILVNDNFRNLEQIVKTHNFKRVSGILIDLGMSSYQIDKSKKGFSFMKDQKLDMRFNANQELSAYKIVNTWPENKLRDLFYKFGELKNPKSIAQKIIAMRKKSPIETTSMLVKGLTCRDAVRLRSCRSYDGQENRVSTVSLNKELARIFQALRIAVNDELNALQEVLPQAISVLDKPGRLAVISFHSLEDRIVKQFFKEQSRDCICPSQIPVCVCNHKSQIKILFKKVIRPSQSEINLNSRSRSAKLRVVEKV